MQTIKDKDPEHPVDIAARLLGGRAAMADYLDVSVAAIGNWKTRGVPIEHCPRIERLTEVKVTRQDLRPNDWQDLWPELAPSLANTAQPATETVAILKNHDANHDPVGLAATANCQTVQGA